MKSSQPLNMEALIEMLSTAHEQYWESQINNLNANIQMLESECKILLAKIRLLTERLRARDE